jgi:hypothetical protein
VPLLQEIILQEGEIDMCDVLKEHDRCPYISCPNHMAWCFYDEINDGKSDDEIVDFILDSPRMPYTCLQQIFEIHGGDNPYQGDFMNLKQIGEALGSITNERVRQIYENAIKKLQRKFGNCEDLRDFLVSDPEPSWEAPIALDGFRKATRPKKRLSGWHLTAIWNNTPHDPSFGPKF